jgi:3-methylfumaryl-CoA hydratase
MASNWDAWIGREERRADQLDPTRAKAWCSMFDLERGLDLEPGATLPQGIHLCLANPDAPTAALGPDGHPSRDMSQSSFMPPIPESTMPRRMWASSKMRFHAAIKAGGQFERVSRIASVTEKTGGSGTLIFVNVEHANFADGALAVEEMQTIVYRAAAAPDAPLSPPPLGDEKFDASEWDVHRVITPDPRLLFRFSALSFNTHRIHYDAPYASEVERYRGLVVHGPLTASLLLQLAASEVGENALRTFSFRGVSPAIADEPLHLVMRQKQGGSGEDIELGAFAGDGRQVTAASASV